MTRFSLPTVLRMVPNPLLREFFVRMNLDSLPIDWDGLQKREIGPIQQALDDLSDDDFDRVESNLHDVCELSRETGFNALVEAAADAGDFDFASRLPDNGGWYHKAMWAWLNEPELVQSALVIHEVQSLNRWRKRTDLPCRNPDTTPEAIERLSRELSDLLVWEQGRGRHCTVETLSRKGVEYFFAWPDDFVQNVTIHDSAGRLRPRMMRKTFQIIFAFSPVDGTLELLARVPPKVRDRIEAVFGRTVLGVELAPWKPETVYDLDVLKDPHFSLATDPEDAVEVRIRAMRLSFRNSHRRITLEADPDRSPDDVYHMINECLDDTGCPMHAVHVTQVTFCFQFAPRGRTRGGTVTFNVTWPNSCTVRSERPERVEIVHKYLKRWGIERDEQSVESAADAGDGTSPALVV